MSGWEIATGVAIWVLIGGSAAIFGWFLVEVRRLARGRRANGRRGRG